MTIFRYTEILFRMVSILATKEDLFKGIPLPLGGLSNELDLVSICPDEFRYSNNRWSRYAAELFYNGGSIDDWKWKAFDIEDQSKQFSCLEGVLSGFGLHHEDKIAVAGWMLSEMIFEIPVYEIS
jgi:hypothetical protein